MSTNIYILKLQGGRYYIGKSENPMKRYQEHLNGSGSAWTRKYMPISVERVIPNASSFDEDKYTKEYMGRYGIEKVRGGAYVLEKLPEFQIEALKSELWGASDKCTTCGRKGHWAKDCYARTDVNGAEIVSESDSEDDIIVCQDCDKEFDSEYKFNKHTCFTKTKKAACYRCGRNSHYSPNCYASTHKDGYELD